LKLGIDQFVRAEALFCKGFSGLPPVVSEHRFTSRDPRRNVAPYAHTALIFTLLSVAAVHAQQMRPAG
jgi:hypothetical protein